MYSGTTKIINYRSTFSKEFRTFPRTSRISSKSYLPSLKASIHESDKRTVLDFLSRLSASEREKLLQSQQVQNLTVVLGNNSIFILWKPKNILSGTNINYQIVAKDPSFGDAFSLPLNKNLNKKVFSQKVLTKPN